jgi:hypothetical protein
MGKQTPVGATQEDEQLLLSFLRGRASITLIECQARTAEDLWVQSFAPELPFHWQYYIWNQEFPWTPEYGRVDHPKADPSTRGLYYVANLHTAPVIEFVRSDFAKKRFGRIYWSKDFAAPNGLAYDVVAFDEWYQTIARWIRKQGKRLKVGHQEAYFLPSAYRAVSLTAA